MSVQILRMRQSLLPGGLPEVIRRCSQVSSTLDQQSRTTSVNLVILGDPLDYLIAWWELNRNVTGAQKYLETIDKR